MIVLDKIEIGHASVLFTIDNLQLEQGEMYALIGANGSGKTTFLQSITGVYSPLKGQIVINGSSISKFNRIDKAKMISFVGSTFDGVEYLKVKDYLALGRTPHTNIFGRLNATDFKVINDTIKLLDLESLQEKYTKELSDGERQLAAIARAIIQETKIIILDEPTAFLDYANRQKVMELMKKISTELNKCVIVSSHDLELCLESEIDLLVVHKIERKLRLCKANALTKTELISIGF
jgi:iron complex transport system ATP-binding protein